MFSREQLPQSIRATHLPVLSPNMSIHFLPPELLLEIFSLTIPNTPSTSWGAYNERQSTLRPLALVHRSWTRIAQDLLWQEVCIAGMGWYSRKRKFAKFARMSGDEPITKHLRMEGHLQSLLDLRRRRGFEQLKTIRYKSEQTKSSRQFAVYAGFRCTSPL